MEEKKSQPIADPNIKTIHTYTSDMADAVRTDEASVIKIALAEKNKREQEELYKEAEGTPISKFALLMGGIILVAGAITGVYFLMQKKTATENTTSVSKAIEALVSYDKEAFIDVTNTTDETDLYDALKEEISNKELPGSIKSLFLTESVNGKQELLPSTGLLLRIKITAPGSFTRTIDSDMLGTYTAASGDPHLFLVFHIKDFNQAYAAMLEWEKTMLGDLSTLFHIDISGDRAALLEKPWKDIILNNKDARILYDTAGNDVLYYIFTDKNTLVITDSRDAIKEITLRLLTKTTKPL